LLDEVRCTHHPIWLKDNTDIENLSKSVEIIVAREHNVEKTILDKFPNFKTLSLAFTGFDEANVEYFIANGINVYSVPGYAADSVAELNIGLTLAILRRIPLADKAIRKGKSERYKTFYPGTELAN